MDVVGIVTDKRFLIGVAVGFLVLPRLSKMARPALAKLKGEG